MCCNSDAAETVTKFGAPFFVRVAGTEYSFFFCSILILVLFKLSHMS